MGSTIKFALRKAVVCCFTCEAEVSLRVHQEHQTGDLSKIDKEDCLWQVIYHDLKLHLPSHGHGPSSANLSPQISAPKSNSRPESGHTAPPTLTPVNQAENDLESSAESLAAVIETEPLVSRPATCPLQPIHLTLTNTSPQYQQQTYASVLQRPTTSSPQPTPRPQPIPLKPTLTIEDLHRRFHNKPSPFEREKRKRKRPKTASAAQALSRLLNSALPAFSRFLAEMQPAADSSQPHYLVTHYSRAIKAS